MVLLASWSISALFFLVAERRLPRCVQRVVRREFGVDLLYIALHLAIRFAVTLLLAVVAVDLGDLLLPEGVTGVVADAPFAWQLVSLVACIETTFYVVHRAKHSSREWWRLHETHHGAVDLD